MNALLRASVRRFDAGSLLARTAMQAERLQLAMQRRTLHADEGRRARYVAAKARYLRQEVFALEDFARIAQRQLHDPPPLPPAPPRGSPPPHVVGKKVGKKAPPAAGRENKQA